jgi:hypothetical protein
LIGGGLGLLLGPAPSGGGPALTRSFAADDPKRAPEGTVTLRWRFQTGKPYHEEQTTITRQTMNVMGMPITQEQKQTFHFRWTPLERKDGIWIIEQKIEGLKMDIDIGGNKIAFDSTRPPAAATPLAEFFKTLVGSKFKLVVTPRMQVIRLEDHDDFVNKLVKANQQMEPLLKQILSDKALRQMADPTFAVINVGEKGPEAVKKGDKWTRKSEFDMGPIGKYDTTYTYTYEGKDGQLDKIKVETALTYTAPGENTPGGLPFKIKKADLKSKDGGGTIWFDNVKGRVDHSEMRMKLDGKLTIEIGGVATEVTLVQEQTTTVRFTDDNPIKAATGSPQR